MLPRPKSFTSIDSLAKSARILSKLYCLKISPEITEDFSFHQKKIPFKWVHQDSDKILNQNLKKIKSLWFSKAKKWYCFHTKRNKKS